MVVFFSRCGYSKKTRRSVLSRWFPSSAPWALPAMLFPSSLGNALFPLAATSLKEKVYPKVLIALTPHRCIYTFITFAGPTQWERSVLGGDEARKLLCCNFYSCFLFNGTNCILCKGGQDRRSLIYKGAGAKLADFHLPSFLFSLSDTQKQ